MQKKIKKFDSSTSVYFGPVIYNNICPDLERYFLDAATDSQLKRSVSVLSSDCSFLLFLTNALMPIRKPKKSTTRGAFYFSVMQLKLTH